MKLRIRSIALILCLIFLLGACSAGEDSDNNIPETENIVTDADTADVSNIFSENNEESVSSPLLWKAFDADGSVVWLFGSIHVGEADFYPLPAYIGDAFDSSEALAVEVNIKNIDLASSIEAMKLLLYSDGSKIYDHISEELYNSAVDILNSLGVYLPLYDTYKPVMWMSLIDSILYEREGYHSDLGVDINLMQTADILEKEIIEIESMETQYSILASFSEELQEYLLQSSVDAYSSEDDTLELLVEAWKNGDEEELLKLLFTEDPTDISPELIDEYNRAMSTDRNILMADFAERALAEDRELFICVGEAHMLGEDGIVSLLINRGYTVDKVSD